MYHPCSRCGGPAFWASRFRAPWEITDVLCRNCAEAEQSQTPNNLPAQTQQEPEKNVDTGKPTTTRRDHRERHGK
jgi:hypothetical protein